MGNFRVGIFSDLHVGVSNDSKMKLEETIICVDWMIDVFKTNGVDTVVFCGDLFDTRYSINVNTLNVGIDIVNKLSNNFKEVYLVIGNHDTYYKNSNEVNSVRFLQEMKFNTKTNNVHVIADEAEVVEMHGAKFAFYPWRKEVEQENIPDYAFGHFEFNGVKMTGGMSSGSNLEAKDLFKLGKMVFGGHYHKPQEIYSPTKKQYVYVVGSPLALNWGEWSDEKRVLILDVDANKVFSYVNDKNAKYNKLYFSIFEKNGYSEDEIKKLCDHMYVKLVIDKEYKYEDIMKYSDMIKKYNCLTFELDYIIKFTGSLILNKNSESVDASNLSMKTNKERLEDYTKQVFEDYKKIYADLDLNSLLVYANNYYDKAMNIQEGMEND